MPYRIKNWQKFQHYKERKPPWIKLYREILDDIEWFRLPDAASKTLVMLWLIGSERGGDLPEITELSFRLRISEQKTKDSLSMLSHWLELDDRRLLAGNKQDATLETERETETDKDVVGQGPTPEDLVLLWNKTAHSNLPRVKFLTEARKRQASCRLKENPSQEFWEGVLTKVNRSPLLRGEKGSWKASFDWVLNPTNLTKVIEGNYDPK